MTGRAQGPPGNATAPVDSGAAAGEQAGGAVSVDKVPPPTDSRGHSHCAKTLYGCGRYDDAYVSDAFIRARDPELIRLRRLEKRTAA